MAMLTLLYSLSSPFMDGASACGFFDLILGLFVEADIDTAGKLIGEDPYTHNYPSGYSRTPSSVLDEAHKVKIMHIATSFHTDLPFPSICLRHKAEHLLD